VNRRKLLSTVNIFFSIITIVLLIYNLIFVETDLTKWALVSLAFAFIAGGLNRYMDKKQTGLAFIGLGVCIVVVVAIKMVQ
jgi:hypothetical protein